MHLASEGTFISGLLLSSRVMKMLENPARKHPAFVAQLVFVVKGKKPAVRVEFELHGKEYTKFII